MQAAYEQYRSGCQLISILTNLEVQLFDPQRISQIHYASYDLPTVLERYKQAALVQVLFCEYVMQESGGKRRGSSPLSG